MKKLASLVVLSLVVFVAGAAAAGKATQVVEGNILSAAPHPDGCYAGLHRRLAIFTQENVNGIIGYHFTVDEKTWKQRFRLTPASAVDVDLLFYPEFGTVAQATDLYHSPQSRVFNTRSNKGEVGVVPPKATRAIVCTLDGVNVDFTYIAGAGVK